MRAHGAAGLIGEAWGTFPPDSGSLREALAGFGELYHMERYVAIRARRRKQHGVGRPLISIPAPWHFHIL